MTKPLIHFAHANGFPAASYKKLFSFLEADADILALDKFAHDPDYPVNNNWTNQADELINYLNKNADRPVIGVGHSFGSIVTFIAACKRPELFSQLIMMDPPLASGRYSHIVKVVKRTPLIEKFTPARLARKRRQQWPLDTDLFSLYQGKGIFKHMDEDCVRDYLAASIDETDHCYKLNFEAETEANLFTSVPDNLNSYKISEDIPVTLIRGELSDVTQLKWIRRFVKRNAVKVLEFAGGHHMFPLEQPEKIASLLKSLMATK